MTAYLLMGKQYLNMLAAISAAVVVQVEGGIHR